MAEPTPDLKTGLLPLVDAWIRALPERDRGSLLWVGRDEVQALRAALVGFQRLRELTAKDRMWQNLDAAERRVTELEQALREIALRTSDRPAFHRSPHSLDRGWQMTDFTYEQVEGNRQRIHELASQALLAPSAATEETEERERQEPFCTGCGDRHSEPFCYG